MKKRSDLSEDLKRSNTKFSMYALPQLSDFDLNVFVKDFSGFTRISEAI